MLLLGQALLRKLWSLEVYALSTYPKNIAPRQHLLCADLPVCCTSGGRPRSGAVSHLIVDPINGLRPCIAYTTNLEPHRICRNNLQPLLHAMLDYIN